MVSFFFCIQFLFRMYFFHVLCVAKNQLNINVTSSLIHILRITQASWTKDLSIATSSASAQTDFVRSHRRTASGKMPEEEWEQGQRRVSTMEKGLALLHSVRFVSTTRQRSKFVPFLLRNNTGLPLKFATLTSVPSKVCKHNRVDIIYFMQTTTTL